MPNETHETAVEDIRHALMYANEITRRLLAALNKLQSEPQDKKEAN